MVIKQREDVKNKNFD